MPEIFWYTGNLRYALAQQPGTAPLVFIVPGTGANFDSGKSLILQRRAVRGRPARGLAAVAACTRTSSSAPRPRSRPGLLRRGCGGPLSGDGADPPPARGRDRRLRDSDLAGYSLGATHAAFVARLDDQRRSFGFEQVLLINPPVEPLPLGQDPRRGCSTSTSARSPTSTPVQPADAAVLRSSTRRPSRSMFSDELVYEIYLRQPPPDSTLEALIGTAFRLSLDQPFVHLRRRGRSRRAGRARSAALDHRFADAVLQGGEPARLRVLRPAGPLPVLSCETAPDISFEELVERNSLRAIEDYLRQATKIGLMHNEDDILLEPRVTSTSCGTCSAHARRSIRRAATPATWPTSDNVAYVIDFFGDRGAC